MIVWYIAIWFTDIIFIFVRRSSMLTRPDILSPWIVLNMLFWMTWRLSVSLDNFLAFKSSLSYVGTRYTAIPYLITLLNIASAIMLNLSAGIFCLILFRIPILFLSVELISSIWVSHFKSALMCRPSGFSVQVEFNVSPPLSMLLNCTWIAKGS